MLVSHKIFVQLPAYYDRYITNIDQENVDEFYSDCGCLSVERDWKIYAEVSTASYANGKWTVIELLQHIIDTERIFQYRAVMMSRSSICLDLPEFDEDEFADNSMANHRNYGDVIDEYVLVRRSTTKLIKSFDESKSLNFGRVNESIFNLNQLGLIMVGHYCHHLRVLNERYSALIKGSA